MSGEAEPNVVATIKNFQRNFSFSGSDLGPVADSESAYLSSWCSAMTVYDRMHAQEVERRELGFAFFGVFATKKREERERESRFLRFR